MRRNIIWIVLLLIVVTCALWFITKAGSEVYTYFQLKERAPVVINSWSVEEIKSDRFAVIAHYIFEYQGKTYEGSSSVGGYYPNPWAAQEGKKQFALKKWSVWINPKDPHHSTLEKQFPLKKSLSALILIGLAMYFFILGVYLRSRN